MTYFPDYLKSYPNMDSTCPLHISLNQLEHGYRAHRHDFLEFSYVIEGEGVETINGVPHKMTAGTFTFVLPYQIHEIFTAPGSKLVLYNCNFSMNLLMNPHKDGGLMALMDMSPLPSHLQLEKNQHYKMLQLVQELHEEYISDKPWKLSLMQAQLTGILISFDRIRQKKETRAVAAPSAQLHKASVWPIIYYIHQHYQESLALSDLAVKFAMSLSRISEVIKETTGQSFVHFLHDLRMRHACSLLASTEMSVAEIALEVGYGSYPTFARVFKATKGIVPKEYRKLMQKNVI